MIWCGVSRRDVRVREGLKINYYEYKYDQIVETLVGPHRHVTVFFPIFPNSWTVSSFVPFSVY